MKHSQTTKRLDMRPSAGPRATPKGPAVRTNAPGGRGEGAGTDWEGVADWYDELVGDKGSEYHREVVIPGVLRMLAATTTKPRRDEGHEGSRRGGAATEIKLTTESQRHRDFTEVWGSGNLAKKTRNGGIVIRSEEETEKKRGLEGLRVLDLACGQGVLCRRLAEEGCAVVGVDASPALIEAARARGAADVTVGAAIRYEVADATKLLEQIGVAGPGAGLTAGGFDAVTLVLAVQNMTPLSPVWQACRELLAPGGAVVVVMMHPCFRVPQHSDWRWEERAGAGGVQSRTVEQYLTSGRIEIAAHPGLAAQGKGGGGTVHFHRPLQAYFNTLGSAGLWVDHIEEWASHKKSQAGPRQKELDRSRKEIPMFLALRARKAGAAEGR